ncbi:MAG TPA: SUMF1/EgtB/PvdO family nonheme iron enzyme [Polyangiaceae bacterium]
MGVSVRRGRSVLALLAAAGVCACNGLLGTPDAVLAGADGGAEAGDGDTSAPKDATIEGAPEAGKDAGTHEAAEVGVAEAAEAGETGDATVGDAGDADADAGDAVSSETDADAEIGDADAANAGDADAGVVASGPPSCPVDGGPGVSTCGTLQDSCCTSLTVPGGTVARSFAVNASGVATNLGDDATVSTFRLDEYEVTLGRFRQFVQASNAGWKPPVGSGIHTHVNAGLGLGQPTSDGGVVFEQGWRASYDPQLSGPDGAAGAWDATLQSCSPSTWTPSPAGQESLPITCINWYEAYAFCIWDGGFLPSEAEWAYAASGGAAQREYAWGSADPGLLNQYADYGCEYPEGGLVDAAFTCSSVANIAPVGTMPLGAGRWLQLDLTGNVHVETVDCYTTCYVLPCQDCADLTPTGFMAARGGSFVVPEGALVTYARFDYPIASRDYKGGVRCARTP